jgi:hypothetical protein
MADLISSVRIPDSKIARAAADLVRQHETEMLFNAGVLVDVVGIGHDNYAPEQRERVIAACPRGHSRMAMTYLVSALRSLNLFNPVETYP